MPRKPNQPLPERAKDLEGVSKAAVLMLAIGPAAAGKLLKHMRQQQVEEVTRELAGLGRVKDSLQNDVVGEFYDTSIATQYANEGNLGYARELLRGSVGIDTVACDLVVKPATRVASVPVAQGSGYRMSNAGLVQKVRIE